jgi:hypothetical protein
MLESQFRDVLGQQSSSIFRSQCVVGERHLEQVANLPRIREKTRCFWQVGNLPHGSFFRSILAMVKKPEPFNQIPGKQAGWREVRKLDYDESKG